jgi:hypothetical protein
LFRRKNKINPALLEKNFNGEIVEFIRFSEKVSFTFANWPFQNADLSMADVQRKSLVPECRRSWLIPAGIERDPSSTASAYQL